MNKTDKGETQDKKKIQSMPITSSSTVPLLPMFSPLMVPEIENKLVLPRIMRIKSFSEQYSGKSRVFSDSVDENMLGILGIIANGNDVIKLCSKSDGSISIMQSSVPGVFKEIEMKNRPIVRNKFAYTFINPSMLVIIGGKGPDVTGKSIIFADLDRKEWKNFRIIGKDDQSHHHNVAFSITKGNLTIIYTFGGYINEKISNQLDMYIFDDTMIKKGHFICSHSVHVPDNTFPSPRYGHSLIHFSNKFVLFGGIDSNGNSLNDLWEFCYSSSLHPIWNLVSASGILPRSFHISYIHNNKICIAGGFDSSGESMNDVWAFQNDEWSQISNYEADDMLYGCESGLFCVNNAISPVKEVKYSKKLLKKFSELGKIQTEYISVITSVLVSNKSLSEYISEVHCALASIGGKIPPDEAISSAFSMVNSGAFSKMENELNELRKDFISLANSYIDLQYHSQAPSKPISRLIELQAYYNKKIQKAKSTKKISNAKEYYSQRNTQTKAENSSSSQLIDPYDFDTFLSSTKAIDKHRREHSLHCYLMLQMRLFEANQRTIIESQKKEQKYQLQVLENKFRLIDIQKEINDRCDKVSNFDRQFKTVGKIASEQNSQITKLSKFVSALHEDEYNMTQRFMEIDQNKDIMVKEIQSIFINFCQNQKSHIERLFEISMHLKKLFKVDPSANEQLKNLVPEIRSLVEKLNL